MSSAHQLPPCKVCGVVASGFHYGVNTCDACKAFFQRSLRRHEEYECSKGNSSTDRKFECRHCRFEKCLASGMSVCGIKIGRYTSKKKADDLLERQRLQQQRRREDEEVAVSRRMLVEAGPTEVRNINDRELVELFITHADLQQLIDIVVLAQHRQVPDITEHLRDLPEIQRRYIQTANGFNPTYSASGGSCTTVTRSPSRSSSCVGAAFEDFSESTSNHSAAASDGLQEAAAHSDVDAADFSFTTSLSAYESQLFEMLPTSWRESSDDFADERRQVLSRWLVILERGLHGIVGFVKEVPGFSDLPTNDKINLVKRSICESWLVTRHRAFNADYGCYTAYNGFTFDLVKAVGQQFSSVLFTAASRIQSLNLTDQETFVLKAFVFFFTDGIELEDADKVEAIQHRLLLALKYMLARSHGNDPLIVARLIGALTELRNVTNSFRCLW